MSGLNPFRHSRKPVPETTFPNPQSQRVNQTGSNNHNNTTPRYYGHDDDAGEDGGREAGREGLGSPGRHTHSNSQSPRLGTKTVRIASPPARSISLSSHSEEFSSPEEGRNHTELRSAVTHRGSPPPPQNVTRGTADDEDNDDDPFNPDNSGSEDGGNNNTNREPLESPRQRPSSSGATWGVSTPDSHGNNGDRSVSGFISGSGSGGGSGGSGNSSAGKRSTMDVDAFKRMLLTGDPGSVPAAPSIAPPTQPIAVPISASAGNAEAGLGSNHPTFGLQTFPTDTTSRRASGDMSMLERKASKPPPPKSRRGKAIGNNPDHTSSSFPLPSVERQSSLSGSQTSINNHKPLPSIPTNLPHPVPDRRVAALSEFSPKPAAQSKRPPTPPLARRHSQMRKNDNPSVSRSNSARLSHPPANPSTSSPLSSSAFGPKNPPPPPSRRVDRTSIVFSPPDHPNPSNPSSFSSASSQSSLPFPLESPSGIAKSELDQTSEKSSLHRSGSSSTISTQRQSRLATPQPQPQPSSSSHVPPRPPPPRRKGRVKSDSLSDSNPVPQQSQQQQQPPQDPSSSQGVEASAGNPAPSNANDILADLSRLQKELDELRGQQ